MYRYLTLILLISMVYGCNSSSRTPTEPIEVDEDTIFQGTVGSLCELVGYQAVKVQGYSLVIGLAGTGSSGCPAPVRTYLEQDLRLLKDQGFLPSAYVDLSIDKLIDHDSTAVVRVSGMVPAGSLRGNRFDVEVTALEGTQTTSLQGGRLVRSQLQVVVPGFQGRPIASRPTALAKGHIFVNPFSVKQGEVLKVDPRRGVVLGGGRATYDSRISLSLLRPDYRKAQLIQNRINSRFQGPDDDKIAEATGRSSITLRAPKAYRGRYSHFISLVWGLYLQGSPGYLERKLMELTDLACRPEADFEAISLAWEGIGKPALPKLCPIYQEVSSGKAAYYAARTALNLEDRKAIDAMIKMALDDTHPYQMLAAQSLSEYPNDIRGRAALLQLLKKDNYRLRLLAYEGLRKGKDIAISSSKKLGEGFTIDETPGSGDPIVAVWATKDPRIVILGAELKCRSNLFYSSADEKATLNARPGDAAIGINLKMPRNMGYVSRKSSFEVRELIEELARPVENKDGKVIGPGLCFSEIVGILYALCEGDMIPARFTLHRIAEDLTG
jgi:flagellar basal body P-ring protein FlgI